VKCHDLDGVDRYFGRAEIYARGRPSYPAAAIAHIAGTNERVIDVGAGTAIGANLMAPSQRIVAAVDANVEMLGVAARARNVSLLAARAEVLPFRTGSADLVTVFNAFHWFQPPAFLEEAHRVLRPGGRLALVWNDWDGGDRFTAEFVRLMRSRAGDFPPEDREGEVAPLYESAWFRSVERTSFPNTHVLDHEGLCLRMKSMSYIPKEGPPWDALERELTALFHGHAVDGVVLHRYRTTVFIADRR
jgi:SAM-dependent methyltransferase